VKRLGEEKFNRAKNHGDAMPKGEMKVKRRKTLD